MGEYRWIKKINPETGKIQAINLGSVTDIIEEHYSRFSFKEARCMLFARNSSDVTGCIGVEFLLAEPCIICKINPRQENSVTCEVCDELSCEQVKNGFDHLDNIQFMDSKSFTPNSET